MRIAFSYNTNAGYENLGVESLSAVLKEAGNEVILAVDITDYSLFYLKKIHNLTGLTIEEKKNERLVKKIQEFRPQLICFSVFTDNYAPTIKMAKLLKEKLGPDTLTIFGGIHATSVPEVIIKNAFVDFVMVGESESSILQLIEALEGKRSLEEVPNLVYRNGKNIKQNKLAPYIRDLDRLPLLDKQIFYDKVPVLKNDYIIMTGRGCPYRCTFCGNSIQHSRYKFESFHVRRRSIDNVINELIIAKERYHPELVSFVDDIFVLQPKKWLYPFLEEYKERVNLPYYCQLHPNHFNPELANKLSQSNCWNVTLGVQSGSPRIREKYFKRKTENSKIIEICKALKNEGLFITLDLIFGCPSESHFRLFRNTRSFSLSLFLHIRCKIGGFFKALNGFSCLFKVTIPLKSDKYFFRRPSFPWVRFVV